MLKVKELFLFGTIGVIGFAVDSGVLYLLKNALGLYAGRAVSFICAVLTTWLLNKLITFRRRRSGRSVVSEALRYGVCMLSGGVANYLMYWYLVSFYLFAQHNPILGVAAGSLAGMIFNYSTAKIFVFNQQHSVSAPTENNQHNR